jgi:hypothetical protein
VKEAKKMSDEIPGFGQQSGPDMKRLLLTGVQSFCSTGKEARRDQSSGRSSAGSEKRSRCAGWHFSNSSSRE